MTQIKVSTALSLPLEVVTDKTAILAKTGAGKSNLAKVIVEGILDAGAQVVILDPVGHWWGLRSLFSIPVLGGMSGDVPLDPVAGKLIAKVVVDSGQSMVLDVSAMDSDGQMQKFALEFAKELYRLKQAMPTAMLLVLEEADEFAPQDTRGAHVPEMVGMFARIAKRGRGRGIGLLSVTLRSASLSKNVLNQSDRVIAMRTSAPLDIKAVRDWLDNVEMPGAPGIPGTLPGLKTGEAWFVDSQRSILQKVMVSKARSLDTSATPKVGELPPALQKKLKPIDLDALGAEMSAMAVEVRENDPKELRKQIGELKRQLAARPTETETVTVEVPVDREVRVEVPVVPEGLKANLISLADTLEGSAARLRQNISEMDDLPKLGEVRVEVMPGGSMGETPPRRGRVMTEATLPTTVRRPAEARPEVTYKISGAETNGSLTGPQQRILDGIAWWGAVGVHEPSLGQLGFFAGYHPRSKGFTNTLSSLNTAGLIERLPGQRAKLTGEGEQHATEPEFTPTDAALQEMIYRQLKPKQGQMLRIIIEHDSMTMDELAAVMDYHPRSKGFTNVVSSLSGLGLVDRKPGGIVKPSDLCFVA